MSQKIINHQMIIDGKYTNSITEKTIEIECPANKRIFASVPRGNEADVDIACKIVSESIQIVVKSNA